jgi:hypothetical protein
LYGILLSLSDSSQEETSNQLISDLDVLIPFIATVLSIFVVLVAWNAGNAFVELIRSRPRRVFNANGVGFHFQFPFLSKKKSDQISDAIWAGKLKNEVTK